MQHKNTIMTIKRTLKGKLSHKASQAQTKEPQNKKRRKGKSHHRLQRNKWPPRYPAPKQRTQAKTEATTSKPLDPPSRDATDTVMQDSEKAKAEYPRSLPDLPKAAHAPEHSNRLQPNPKIILPRQVISLRSKARKQSFSDNK